ncbi:hypothetical protein D8W71_21730 [Rhodococcus sp. P1Y]|nr:hypothetical protein D8W71_21730 [Rhodococcus sp. P1Y]
MKSLDVIGVMNRTAATCSGARKRSIPVVCPAEDGSVNGWVRAGVDIAVKTDAVVMSPVT